MEGTESEAIFDSLNLNPQLFINEVLNRVDDLVDGAFDFYHQEASNLLKIEGTDRAAELKKGVGLLQNMIHLALDRPLTMWEKYCLRHCFVVLEGFKFPEATESSGDANMDDAIGDTELDLQLNSLREKLVSVENESAELNRELAMMERQSVASNRCAESLNDVVQLCEQYFDREMFEELIKTASELRTQVDKVKSKRVEEADCIEVDGSWFRGSRGNGLVNTTLDELQQFIKDI